MSSDLLCKLLIVEDDEGIVKFLKTALAANGYDVITCDSGKAALEMITSHCPDCILLDLGADDYLIKPFGTIELMARIRTAIRHTRTTTESDSIALSGAYKVGDLVVDYRKLRVFRGGEDMNLTPNEFKIVALLAKYAGRVITYKTILRELWGPFASRDNKILRVHMANIRRKIEPNPDTPIYIFTEVGVGYRMAEDE